MGATAFAYTPHPRPRAAVGYHPRLGPLRLQLQRWVISERAGRWNAAYAFPVEVTPIDAERHKGESITGI